MALLLRLPGLTESIWYDEVWATRIRLQSAGRLWDVLRLDVHPPLYSVVMFVWIRLFGDSELSIRFPSLIAGLGTVVMVLIVGRRLVSRHAAWVAAALLSVSPVHIWYSQEARHYAILVFLLLLALEAFYRIRSGDSGRVWWWVYAVALTTAVLTHFYAIAFVGVLALITHFGPPSNRRRLHAIHALGALALIAFIGWRARFGALSTSAGHLRSFDVAGLLDLLFDWFLTGDAVFVAPQWHGMPHALAPWALGVASATLFAAGAISVVRRTEGRHLLLCFGAVPMLLMMMTLLGFEGFYIERSALPALPFFLLVLATGLTAVRPAPVRAALLTTSFLGAAAVLAGLYSRQGEWTVYKPNPDWRSAASALSTDLASPEPIILVAASPTLPLLYYGLALSVRWAGQEDVVGSDPAAAEPSEGLLSRVSAWTAFGGPGQHPPPYSRGARDEVIQLREDADSVVSGVLDRAGVDRFILIHNEFWPDAFDPVFDQLRDRFTEEGRRHFKGLELIEMVRRPQPDSSRTR